MRGALSSTIAAIRAYRRVAALTKPTRSAEHDLSSVGVHPTAGAAQFADGLFKSPRRRSVIAMGAAITLAIIGFAAACLGASKLNGGSNSGRPHTVIEPYGAVPAATSSNATKNTANEHTPTGSPLSATGVAGGMVPGATQAAAGSTSGTGAGTATGTGGGTGTGVQTSAAAAPSTSASAPTASPTLLDLCRSVVAAGNGWPSVLKGADRATVIAAAGTKKNVLPYCTNLVANAS
jgi:hypothetical protein